MSAPSESTVESRPMPREQGSQAARREPGRAAAVEETEQLIFTLRKTNGEVVRIEKVDSGGKRSEIQKDEAAMLAGKQNLDEVESALDEAFEAGIFSVLDPGGQQEAAEETDEEIDLRRLMLKLIIGREVRQRLQSRIAQRLILSQALGH